MKALREENEDFINDSILIFLRASKKELKDKILKLINELILKEEALDVVINKRIEEIKKDGATAIIIEDIENWDANQIDKSIVYEYDNKDI